jgi:hypothetical protein
MVSQRSVLNIEISCEAERGSGSIPNSHAPNWKNGIRNTICSGYNLKRIGSDVLCLLFEDLGRDLWPVRRTSVTFLVFPSCAEMPQAGLEIAKMLPDPATPWSTWR